MNKAIETIVAVVIIACVIASCSKDDKMDNKELTVIVQAQQQTIRDLQNQIDHLHYMAQDHEDRIDDIESKLHM